MQIKAEISLEYYNKTQASIALKSLQPENENYLESEISGSKIKFNLSGKSLRSILATADDLIFCEMTVEKILEKTKGS
jgi:hypothetical protein